LEQKFDEIPEEAVILEELRARTGARSDKLPLAGRELASG